PRRRSRRTRAAPKENILKRSGRFSEERKNPDQWRLSRLHGLNRLERQRMALAEVARHETAKKLLVARQHLLRRMFTVRRRTARKRSKVCSVRCCSRRATSSPNVSRKSIANIFTFRRTRPFTMYLSIFGTPARPST